MTRYVVVLVAVIQAACWMAEIKAEHQRRTAREHDLVQRGMSLEQVLRGVVFEGKEDNGTTLRACGPATEAEELSLHRQTTRLGQGRYSLLVLPPNYREYPSPIRYESQEALLKAAMDRARAYGPCVQLALGSGEWHFTVIVDAEQGVQHVTTPLYTDD